MSSPRAPAAPAVPPEAAPAADPTIDGTASALCSTSMCSLSLTTSDDDDVVVLFFSFFTASDGNPTTVTVSDHAGLDWTPRAANVDPATFFPATVATGESAFLGYEYYAVASDPLSGDAITVSFNPSIMPGASALAFGVAGSNTASPFDSDLAQPAVNQGTSDEAALSGAGTITTASDGDLILGLVALENFSSVSPESSPESFTLVGSAPAGSATPDTASAGESYSQPASGAVAVTATWSPDYPLNWGLIADALVPFVPPPLSVTLSPPFGPLNTTGYLSATGLTPGASYQLDFDTTQGSMETGTDEAMFTAGGGGSITGLTFLYIRVTPGTYYADLYEVASEAFVTSVTTPASGEVTITTVAMSLDLSAGPPNTQVALSATGLAPSTTYDLYFNLQPALIATGALATTFTSDSSGAVSDWTFQVPAASLLPESPATYTASLFELGSLIGAPFPQFTVTLTSVYFEVAPGPDVTTEISASSLAISTWYYVYLDESKGMILPPPESVYLAECMTNGQGAFTDCEVTIPSDLGQGTYYIDLYQDPAPLPFILTLASFYVPVHAVTFTETGIPAKTLSKDGWTVVLNDTREHGKGSTLSFTGAQALVNGTYPVLITGPKDYASYAGGTVTVAGATSVSVAFAKGATATVGFREKGVPKGNSWCVSLDAAVQCTTKPQVKYLNLSYGTYDYAVVRPATNVTVTLGKNSEPVSGPIAVELSLSFKVTFQPTYLAVFTETGSYSGTWSVTIKGTTLSAPTGSPITFRLGNGTYTYSIAKETGFKATGMPSKLEVAGPGASVRVTFTAKP